MKKLRGAIVGFGNVAIEAHVPGFERAPGFEIVAIADPSPEQRAAATARLPAARTYETLEALATAEARLDFVDVATPPCFHAPIVTRALESGLHVLCEKPLALGAADLADLQRAARRTGRALFTVHNWKYAPLLRRLRGLIVAGTVGEPTEIEWTVLRPNPPQGAVAAEATWRLDRGLAGGGVLMDHGWHAFYLMLYLTAREPRSIAARLGHERGLAVEDVADCVIDFGRCRAKIHLSWVAGERRTAGAVRGPSGTIEASDDAITVSVGGRLAQRVSFLPPLSASSYHPEWFPALLEDFRAEVLHADRRGRNLAEAVRCSEMMTAAYSSEGEPVELPSRS